MTTVDRARKKVVDATLTLEQLTAELDRVQHLPEEPFDSDGNGMVWFQKYYRSDVPYTYAAVRIRNSHWVVTGQTTDGSKREMTWAELLDFMAQGERVFPQVWLATEMSRLI